jgi:C4-dicarboxylate transporter
MEIAIGLIVVVVIAYLIINGRRNSDPLNRKCAAEICLADLIMAG